MAGSVLEYRLSAVAGRLHRLRILRRQTVCWVLVLIPAVAVCLLLPTSGLPLRRELLSLLIACAAGFLLARRKQVMPTSLETARLIEQHNPGLNDVVLTAVRQESSDRSVSPVLASRVLEEADAVALVADWTSVVSGRQLFKWSVASLLTFAVLVSSVVTAGRWLPTAPVETAEQSAAAGATTTLNVEPGDIEVEEGTGLTVVARFQGSIPSHASIRVTPDEPIEELDEGDDLSTSSTVTHNMSLTVDAGVFMVRLPAVTGDGSYVVVYGDEASWLPGQQKTSDAYRITTFVRPRVVQVDASVTPPSWTGREPSTIEDTLRIVAIEGSQVTLQLHLNKPVATCHLQSGNGTMIPLDEVSSDRRMLQAVVTAEKDSVWTVLLQDEKGRSAREETQIRLSVIRNNPPTIRITFPRPDVSVSALQEVLTEADATDDFGLVDYGITFSLSGDESRSVSLAETADTQVTSASMSQMIDLESLNAKPGDVLLWNFYADTFVADGEIQRSLSDLMIADVRRFEEVFRESAQQGGQGQQQNGGATDDLLQIQRQIVIALWNAQRLQTGSVRRTAGTAEEDIGAIRASQEVAIKQLSEIRQSAAADPEIADAIESAGDHMHDVVEALSEWSVNAPQPAIADASGSAQAAFRQLLRLRAAEHDVQRSQSQGGAGSGGQNSAMQQQLNQLELDNDRNRYETEQQQQQDQQSQEQREQLQILSRLRELARRQNVLNERLRQLESELRNADTEDERERIERELKRLRDEQQELLRDVDELSERMDQSASRDSSQQGPLRDQVTEAREHVREASRAMDEGNLAEALSEGTRAERQFDRLQEEYRSQTSSAFTEAARELRKQARELTERQQKIARQLAGEHPDDTPNGESSDARPSLRGRRPDDEIQRRLGEQRDRLQHIIDRSKELIDQSEDSEPLLSRRLYEAVRQVTEQRTEDALRAAEFLAGRGLWPQVAEPEQAARRGLEKLRQGIESAAEAVLGGEAEALQRAQQTLEQLSDELADELSEATAAELNGRSDQQGPGMENAADSGTQAEESGPSDSLYRNHDGQPRRQPQRPEQPTSSSRDESEQHPSSAAESLQSSPSGQPGNSESTDADRGESTNQSASPQQPGQADSDSAGKQSAESDYSVLRGGGRNSGGPTAGRSRPLTGSDFQEWSDRLRDVEEILDDPELRHRVARVRDRARSIRAEFRRHGTEPRWDLVKSDLLHEMRRLERRLAQEIIALRSDHSMAPIDREPVPEEFDELVQRYYELLGQERIEATR